MNIPVTRFVYCPCCGASPFVPFHYGHVFLGGWRRVVEQIRACIQSRPPRTLAVICDHCRQVVAHQGTDGGIDLDPRRGRSL